jgi:RimJ/RimL family protein N-acetyltransferase
MIAKLAAETDFDFYYKLKCDDANIYWSGHSSKPDIEKLRNWFLVNINRLDRIFFLFFDNEKKDDVIGYLYLDLVDVTMIDNGYGVYSTYAGKGFGTKILKYGIDYAKTHFTDVEYFQSWILSDNIGSIKMVQKLGYQKTEETKMQQMGDGEEKVMEKYLLKIK